MSVDWLNQSSGLEGLVWDVVASINRGSPAVSSLACRVLGLGLLYSILGILPP